VAATLAPLAGTQLLARAGAGALWSSAAALCVLLAAVHLRVTRDVPPSAAPVATPADPPAPLPARVREARAMVASGEGLVDGREP
jgi:hypothetical protein